MLRTLLGPALAILVAAVPAPAQCTPVAGTGCPGASAITCGGQPTIGAPVRFRCPTGAGGLHLLLVGSCAAPIPIGPPGCSSSCTLGVAPSGIQVFAYSAPALAVFVPNDPTLQGLQFCIQCASFDPVLNCLSLSQASSFVMS